MILHCCNFDALASKNLQLSIHLDDIACGRKREKTVQVARVVDDVARAGSHREQLTFNWELNGHRPTVTMTNV
jgi:hypothetical protein